MLLWPGHCVLESPPSRHWQAEHCSLLTQLSFAVPAAHTSAWCVSIETHVSGLHCVEKKPQNTVRRIRLMCAGCWAFPVWNRNYRPFNHLLFKNIHLSWINTEKCAYCINQPNKNTWAHYGSHFPSQEAGKKKNTYQILTILHNIRWKVFKVQLWVCGYKIL